jgi:Ras-related protein Rab-7A
MKQPIYKICILGDGGVGKTTLVNKFITGLFQDNLKITIGVNFYVKKFDYNEYNITLQLWDLAGEDRFRFILPSYLLGAAGAIFMYDITRYSSFKNFFTWMDIFKDCSLKNQNKIPMIMVGGKSDLESKRAVDKEEVFKVVQSNNILDYLECSAKTGDNVDQIFHKITEIIMKKQELI